MTACSDGDHDGTGDCLSPDIVAALCCVVLLTASVCGNSEVGGCIDSS